jgi:hypothetical protein
MAAISDLAMELSEVKSSQIPESFDFPSENKFHP